MNISFFIGEHNYDDFHYEPCIKLIGLYADLYNVHLKKKKRIVERVNPRTIKVTTRSTIKESCYTINLRTCEPTYCESYYKIYLPVAELES